MGFGEVFAVRSESLDDGPEGLAVVEEVVDAEADFFGEASDFAIAMAVLLLIGGRIFGFGRGRVLGFSRGFRDLGWG